LRQRLAAIDQLEGDFVLFLRRRAHVVAALGHKATRVAPADETYDIGDYLEGRPNSAILTSPHLRAACGWIGS
jgi:hypothetical protein